MRNERKGKNQGEADVVCREAGTIHNWWLPMHRLMFWHSERYINYILSAYTNTVISTSSAVTIHPFSTSNYDRLETAVQNILKEKFLL